MVQKILKMMLYHDSLDPRPFNAPAFHDFIVQLKRMGRPGDEAM
jgi:hypothetical protein